MDQCSLGRVSPLAKGSGSSLSQVQAHQRMGAIKCFLKLNGNRSVREFAEQQRRHDLGSDDEAHPMDMDFVNALEFGIPPNWWT